VPTSGLVGTQRHKGRLVYYTLGNKDCGVDPDSLARVRFVVRADRRRCGDEVGTCKAG